MLDLFQPGLLAICSTDLLAKERLRTKSSTAWSLEQTWEAMKSNKCCIEQLEKGMVLFSCFMQHHRLRDRTEHTCSADILCTVPSCWRLGIWWSHNFLSLWIFSLTSCPLIIFHASIGSSELHWKATWNMNKSKQHCQRAPARVSKVGALQTCPANSAGSPG